MNNFNAFHVASELHLCIHNQVIWENRHNQQPSLPERVEYITRQQLHATQKHRQRQTENIHLSHIWTLFFPLSTFGVIDSPSEILSTISCAGFLSFFMNSLNNNLGVIYYSQAFCLGETQKSVRQRDKYRYVLSKSSELAKTYLKP